MSEFLNNSLAELNSEELPWLVFKLHNLTYTVNSRIVSAILQYPDNVTPVASSPDTFRGIINFREGILPLLDLRTVFRMKSTQEDYKEFMELVNTMKSEVDSYFSVIKSAIVSNEVPDVLFNTEMTVCSKWKYQAQRHQSSGNLKLGELPLSLIDRFTEFEEFSKSIILLLKREKFEKDELLKTDEFKGFKKAEGDIHKILSDAVDSYQESYKEMVVAVSKDDSSLGLIVDEVVAVEELEIVSDEQRFPKFQKENFFTGVAHSTKIQGEILIINEDLILKMSSEFDNAS